MTKPDYYAWGQSELIEELEKRDRKLPPCSCPLCGIPLKHETSGSDLSKATHVYACEECPFVGFEYYNRENLDNLSRYLSSFY